MIVLDWNKRNTIRMKKQVQIRSIDGVEEIHYCNPKRKMVENITFRIFPNLHIETTQMIGCSFEDCGEVYLVTYDIGHGFCRFNNIKLLVCNAEFLKYCEFSDIECANTTLVELNNCYCSSCTFENIKLFDNAYLVHGTGRTRGYGFKLNNMTSEREDKLFFKTLTHYNKHKID